MYHVILVREVKEIKCDIWINIHIHTRPCSCEILPRCVCLQVGTKASRLCECLAAAATLVGLFPGVQSLVAAQCGGLGEGALAELALVGLFASVDASVCPKAAL